MSDKSNQNISELMDGELDHNSSQFLLKRMMSDKTLSESWNTYHLIRSYLQKEEQAPLVNDMGQAVIARLKGETLVPADQTGKAHKFLKPFLGSTIAASVAIMAVFMFNGSNNLAGDPPTDLLLSQNNLKTSAQLINPPAAHTARAQQPARLTRFPSLSPQIQQYLVDKNRIELTQYPFYYNTEYLNQLKVQPNVNKDSQNIAD